MSVLAAGQLISERYQLDRRIAVGGMGEVWEAKDTRLGRSVAVKVLKAELSDDPEFLHRFRIEARTVASLDHTGIASVHDYGEDDGPAGGGRTAYLVMELVRGEPLSSRISRGAIPPHEALDIVEQSARALQAAHERGFVHRDVKPGNILLRNDGVVKLTDFGIAKAADAVPVTRSGMVMGTAHYIAPEQASGDEAGPAGDVYSLGIVGYECLAGQRPFRAESAVAVAMMQVRDDPPPLPADVPERIRGLIYSVLVKDPALRYADGGEFADAVAAVRRGERAPAAGADPEDSAVNSTTPARAMPPRRSSGQPGDGPAPNTPAPFTPAPNTPAPNTPAPNTPAPFTPAPRRGAAPGTSAPRGPAPQSPPRGGPGGPRTPLPPGQNPRTPVPHDPGPPSSPRHRALDAGSGPVTPGPYASGPMPVRPAPGGEPAGRDRVGPDGGRAAGGTRPAPPRPPHGDTRWDTRGDARGESRAVEQARGTEHPSGPLDVAPRRSGRSRALLAALFVILTIAAVLLAVMILRGTSLGGLTGGYLVGAPGTVTGWKGDRTGPAAVIMPSVADRVGVAVR
ncbi:serine/threonine protein kinase [Pseudonocardia sediminis]|uniref:non-specific serine/threonine protein kinase n=1 Tax=Pseudonocardia sediminis TaxID=1397368 RepID=A0A4Q7UNY8_PSEST|nr:serine/threonine protein kinase [Pseudonocardia sediminis]